MKNEIKIIHFLPPVEMKNRTISFIVVSHDLFVRDKNWFYNYSVLIFCSNILRHPQSEKVQRVPVMVQIITNAK